VGDSPELAHEDQADSFDMTMDARDLGEDEAKHFAEPALEPGEELDFDSGLSFNVGQVEDEFKPDSVEFTPSEPLAKEPQLAEAENADMGSVERDMLHIAQDNTLEFDLEGLDLGGEEEMDLPGDGELADLDEVSTKLDLARAYLDMGDPDGARSILGEVIEEGSDDQKSEAQQILEKIA
jgi:pilus assembly protein FimV